MIRWRSQLLWLIAGAAAVYAMVCVDVVLRARQAYLEGEHASNAGAAYAWYESAATLFTPPESRWSRLARAKMPQAKARWKAELQSRHLQVTDDMLE